MADDETFQSNNADETCKVEIVIKSEPHVSDDENDVEHSKKIAHENSNRGRVRKRKAAELNSTKPEKMVKLFKTKSRVVKKEFDFWQENPDSTYGLSREFLHSLGIALPLTNWINVENMQCESHEAREMFQLSGNILYCDVSENLVKIMFSHPIEAVQAISMFNNQKYKGQELNVKMCESQFDVVPKLISSIGPGLGIDGAPLCDVTRQMERYLEGKSSKVNKNNLEIIPNDNLKRSVTASDVEDYNSSVQSKLNHAENSYKLDDIKKLDSNYNSDSNDSDTEESCNENSDKNINVMEFISVDYSQSEKSFTKNKTDDKKVDLTENYIKVFPDKALVPQSVAEKIVSMIKRGWTAIEILNVLNSADSRKSEMANTGLNVMGGNFTNNVKVIPHGNRFPNPIPPGTVGQIPPFPIVGNTLPVIGNPNPVPRNSMATNDPRSSPSNSNFGPNNMTRQSGPPIRTHGPNFGPAGPTLRPGQSLSPWNSVSSSIMEPATVELSNVRTKPKFAWKMN